jgi:hypothetical protein
VESLHQKLRRDRYFIGCLVVPQLPEKINTELSGQMLAHQLLF